MTRPDDPDLREYWTERAAIAEYLGGMSRKEAERSATEQTEAYRKSRR